MRHANLICARISIVCIFLPQFRVRCHEISKIVTAISCTQTRYGLFEIVKMISPISSMSFLPLQHFSEIARHNRMVFIIFFFVYPGQKRILWVISWRGAHVHFLMIFDVQRVFH